MFFDAEKNFPHGWRWWIAIVAISLLVIGSVLPYVPLWDSDPYTRVDLKSLGWFEMDQNAGTLRDVPRKYVALDGQKVCLEGFMWSDVAVPSVEAFQFVYNISPPGPHGPPLVQERVFAKVAAGKRIPLSGDFMSVRGTLHVNVKHDSDGTITSVYEMDVDDVSPVDSQPTKPNCVLSASTASISIGGLMLTVWTYTWLIAFSNARRRAAAGK